MTRDEVYKLIEDNGLTLHGDVEHFAELVAQHEREACAKLCESEGIRIDASYLTCAEFIRARG